jgi:TRAP-type C4-dicarboxylate transport system permease small subunit
MKRMALQFILSILLLLMSAVVSFAQCSLCTKTASQLGEKPALGLNQGILYLMLAPFAVIGIIAYRWWKNNH